MSGQSLQTTFDLAVAQTEDRPLQFDKPVVAQGLIWPRRKCRR